MLVVDSAAVDKLFVYKTFSLITKPPATYFVSHDVCLVTPLFNLRNVLYAPVSGHVILLEHDRSHQGHIFPTVRKYLVLVSLLEDTTVGIDVLNGVVYVNSSTVVTSVI